MDNGSTENQVRPSYIVFSDDWGIHPSSCQHLFKRIAQTHSVLWVNTIMRMPKLNVTDAKKIYQKFFPSENHNNVGESDLKLSVKKTFIIPLFNKFFRLINKRLLILQLKSVIRKNGFQDAIFVTTVPIAADIATSLGAQKIIYYCVDEFSEWPGHSQKQMKEMEGDLLKVSDVVITTSETLYHSKEKSSKKIHWLPHGVDVAHFQVAGKATPIDLQRPILGYYGLFDERNDVSLLKFLLENKPEWQILVIGRVQCNVSEFQKYPNISFFGQVSYDELPGYVKNFDVCILPYCIDKLTEFINPLKFKEYLATGIPVVATALPSLEKYQDVIRWSTTHSEFLENTDYYLTGESSASRHTREELTQKYLIGESWEEKADKFLNFIHR